MDEHDAALGEGVRDGAGNVGEREAVDEARRHERAVGAADCSRLVGQPLVHVEHVRNAVRLEDVSLDLGVGHVVALASRVGVRRQRVAAGSHFVAVRNAVVVRVGIVRIRAVEVGLVRVREAVAVGVDHRRALFVRLRHVFFENVGNLVLIEVAVLDVDCCGRIGELFIRYDNRLWRIAVLRIVVNSVGVAPGFPSIALAVVVGVDVGEQVDLSGCNALQGAVGRHDVTLTVEVRQVRQKRARDRLLSEVGRCIDLHYDIGRAREVGADSCAVVAHSRREVAIACLRVGILVAVAGIHVECAPSAPVFFTRNFRILGVQKRHAPLVVRAVGEDWRAVRRREAVGVERRSDFPHAGIVERVGLCARKLHRAGVPDDGAVFRRDLETVGAHRGVDRREAECRACRIHGSVVDRRHGDGHRSRRCKTPLERPLLFAVDIYLVHDRADVGDAIL